MMLPPTQQTAHQCLPNMRPVGELASRRPHGDRLRYMAGCRCDSCRAANAAYERMRIAERKAGNGNPLVPADKAQAHLLALAAAGVGRASVHEATDINLSILQMIEMKMLGSRQDGDSSPRQQSAPQPPRTQQSRPQPQSAGSNQGGFGDFDDDIPFLRHGHGAAWRAL